MSGGGFMNVAVGGGDRAMDGDGGGDPVPLRLAPEIASTRLLVLRFVRDYIRRWGASPSYGEIAAGVNAHRSRVRRAVKRLAAEGLLLRRPGGRGLSLPDDRASALRVLAALGWTVMPPDGETGTNATLLAGPVLDYDPAHGQGSESREPDGGPDRRSTAQP
ncbi:GntR family transcriptional regulator [Novosphingobium sp. EMRT-2]|nr:GntR family transcriptional regulator [Novosphingobium sp. EMRT-2]